MRIRRVEALALLGLAMRAGAVVKGVEGTRRCLRKGEAGLILLARDGAEGQRRKVVPLAEARGVPWRYAGSQDELGAAVGSGPLTVVAVTGSRLVAELLERTEDG